MKPTIAKKYLTFILLVVGMFSFFVADAQFICDCVPGKPRGYCYVDNQGQTKCFKLKKINPGWLKDQRIESASLAISPNPGSNSATISFFLEHSQKVTLRIFDVVGRLISTSAEKFFGEGENKLVWDTEKMKGEIYFLQFQSGEDCKTVKWVVTK